jgi:hypothetical protein
VRVVSGTQAAGVDPCLFDFLATIHTRHGDWRLLTSPHRFGKAVGSPIFSLAWPRACYRPEVWNTCLLGRASNKMVKILLNSVFVCDEQKKHETDRQTGLEHLQQ